MRAGRPQRGDRGRSGHGGGHARVRVPTRGNDPRREVPPRSTARSRPGAGPPRHGRRPRHRGRRRRRDAPRRRRARAPRRRRDRRRSRLPGPVLARDRLGLGRAGDRALGGVPHRRRRQPARGLPHRRRRQLRAGVLGRPGPGLPRGADAVLQRADADRRAARRRRRSGRSTARATSVYIDLGFYDELRTRFGARGGPFAEAYVIAHEYGHHVQHLLGTDRRVGPENARGRDVRLGAARAAGRLLRGRVGRARRRHRASSRTSPQPTSPTASTPRPRSATTASSRRATGRVDRESWTHGSSAQRQRWFPTGYRSGDPNRCDTFAAGAL